MHAATKPEAQTIARRRGRPRRLDIDQIIDAAQALGLESLTMSRLAAELGVAKAVLYNYVVSRDELVILVTARAARLHTFPEDNGQPWKDYVHAHARALFDLLTSNEQLLVSIITGSIGPLASADRAEKWLQAMTDRGFAAADALRLLRAIGFLVTGAAVTFLHDKARAASTRPSQEEPQVLLDASEVDHLPLIQSMIGILTEQTHARDWEKGLAMLLSNASLEPAPPASANERTPSA